MPRYTIHGDAYYGFHLSPLDERPSRAERLFIELTEDEFAEWQRTDAAYEDWQDRINRASEDEANRVPGVSPGTLTELAFQQLRRDAGFSRN